VTEFNEWLGAISPDGHWLAYQSDESGKYEIYVRPFPSGGGKWQLSTGGGQGPFWKPDGRELYFESDNGKFMKVNIQMGERSLRTGIPEPLFDLAGREQISILDVSAEGDRFVAQVSAIERSINPVTLVLNWQRDMERKFR
jgi:Tol biopolymer transport system component